MAGLPPPPGSATAGGLGEFGEFLAAASLRNLGITESRVKIYLFITGNIFIRGGHCQTITRKQELRFV